MGGLLYFNANDGVNDWQLWRTDGTTAGTERVSDIQGSIHGNLTVMNGRIYFGDYNDIGTGLFRSVGPAAGTILLLSVKPAAEGRKTAHLAAIPVKDRERNGGRSGQSSIQLR